MCCIRKHNVSSLLTTKSTDIVKPELTTPYKLQPLALPTTIVRSHFEIFKHKRRLNNDQLSTTATIFVSQGWSFYTSLTVICVIKIFMKRKVFIELKNIVQFILREICGSMTPLFPIFLQQKLQISFKQYLASTRVATCCLCICFCCKIYLKDLSWLMPKLGNQGNYFKNGTTLF